MRSLLLQRENVIDLVFGGYVRPFPVIASVVALLSGCASLGQAVAPMDQDVFMVDGPPVRRVETAYDDALACIGNRAPRSLTFAVGAINDATGKESYADAGSGKMVTQGAGDMIQTALFNAGVQVVNRRDPAIAATEHNWGIRDITSMKPADLFITGSINSLDFIPGAGASVTVSGVGPKARQNRLLVGMDLAMTNALTGEIVANVAIQKQLVGKEIGFAIGRFFDTSLVDISAGAMEREATNAVFRQMLYYGVYQLLLQASDAAESAGECNAKLTATIAEDLVWEDPAGRASLRAIASEVEAARPPSEQEVAQMRAEMTTAAPVELSAEARKLANNVTTQAARAISMFDTAVSAKNAQAAQTAFEKGKIYLSIAIRDLRAGASVGLTGPVGDAAATLVEQAIRAGSAAEIALAVKIAPKDEEEAVIAPETATDPAPPSSPAKPSNVEGKP